MIFLIPARAGSKRLPGKNKRLFCGLPLWMWSLATARRVAEDGDLVIVSTDDEEIQAQARALNVAIHYRSPALSCDTAKTIDVVYDVMDSYDHSDTVCVLQPTSPDRLDESVHAAISASHRTGKSVRGCLSGHPTGAVYVYRRDCLPDAEWSNAEMAYAPASDIDTESDFLAAERLMAERLHADA